MLRWAGVPGLLGDLGAISSWKAIDWIVTGAYYLILAGLVFRRLGSDGFALWTVIISTRALLQLIAEAPSSWARGQIPIGAFWRYLGVGTLAAILVLGVAEAPVVLLRLSGPAASTARWVAVLMVADAAVALVSGRMTATLKNERRASAFAIASSAQAAVGLAVAWAVIGRWGLVGVGAAVLLARLVAGSIHLSLRSRPRTTPWWESMQPEARLRLVSVPRIVAPAAGILVVAGFYGSGPAALYGLGAALAATASRLLFSILEAAFPRLAEAPRAEAARLIRWMLIVGCAFGALGFGAIALNARDLLQVWVGSAPNLAVQVLVLFAAAALLSVPGFVIAVAAAASGARGVLTRLVISEAAANIALMILAATYSPLGPALATLATSIAFSLVVLPSVLRRPLGVSLLGGALQVLVGMSVGLALSVVIWTAGTRLPDRPYGPIAAALAGTAVTALGFVTIGPRIGRSLARWWMIIRVGGVSVWIRQRNEVIAARKQLQLDRLRKPAIWLQSSPPLVTVRIATYNRGRLVAERAIASALNQTHTNVEVVVVGDHCDEATEEAVLSVRDPRVRFENLPQRGDYPSDPAQRWMVAGTTPMNRGLDLARGDWIAPLDDDDEFTPDHVEVLLEACRTRELEFAYGVAEMEVQPGSWDLVGWWPLADGGIVHASALYMARIAFLRHDIESWKLCEPGDWNVWKRMRAAGVRMGFVDRVVCRHYLTSAAAMVTP